jgi:RHS repeat-associated protein
MAMDGPWMSVGSMDYGYNGVEYEDFMGLDMNLATYRGLDPALGRWCQVDPKAEAARGYSPYTSMHDNPIRYTDPNGDFIPAAILGAGVGLITNGISNLAQGNSFFQGGLKAAAFGALGGASSFGIGQIFGKSGNFGHELLRAGAHGFSSGIQSELAGGSFGSGILGGAIASGIGSGIGVSGLKGDALVSAQIAGGGIGGGIGSSLAGGRFMSGFSNGLLVGGLNHVAHSGALGENFAAALVTGRVRHILGPDAIHFTAGFEIGLAPLFDIKFGKLLVLRGKYAGSLKNLWEFGVGGGLEMGVGVGDTKLYYSGSSKLISPETFTGFRIQGVVSGSIGIEVGKSISFSRINKKDFVLGIGNSIGVGLGVLPGEIGVGLSGNITYGYSFFPTY